MQLIIKDNGRCDGFNMKDWVGEQWLPPVDSLQVGRRPTSSTLGEVPGPGQTHLMAQFYFLPHKHTIGKKLDIFYPTNTPFARNWTQFFTPHQTDTSWQEIGKTWFDGRDDKDTKTRGRNLDTEMTQRQEEDKRGRNIEQAPILVHTLLDSQEKIMMTIRVNIICSPQFYIVTKLCLIAIMWMIHSPQSSTVTPPPHPPVGW